MNDILKSVGDFFIMFLLLLVIGGVIELSSIVLEINSTLSDILLASSVLLFFVVFSFRILKRHHLKTSTFLFSIAIILILTSVIPDQTPASIHSARHIYTFGFPFPFLSIHDETTNANFFLQHSPIKNDYSANPFPLMANIFLIYFLLHYGQKMYNKTITSTRSSNIPS